MSSANLDRLLAVLVVAMATTGLATLRTGTPSGAWLFVVHGLLAGALAVAVIVKLGRSVPRAIAGGRWRALVVAGVVSLGVIGALSLGWLWVTSAGHPSIRGWTILVLHAWIGLALVPLLVVHLLPHRWRLLRVRVPAGRGRARVGISRRALLIGGGLGLAGIGAFVAAEVVQRWRGAERRFTGSRFLPAGGVPPPTTFFGEPVPAIDVATWQLRVHGHVDRELALSLADLRALGEETATAVLDCTAGWALETTWHGVGLATLLEVAGATPEARSVTVRAVSGWSAVFPLTEARACLLATGVAGGDLAAGNGAPCRLVAPDRRGLDWVKWVAEVEVV